MTDYFGVMSLNTQDALLEGRSSPAASVVDEAQRPAASSAVAYEADGDVGWDFEAPIKLGDLERFGANRRLRDFEDSCLTENRRVTGTVTEAFELASELVNQEASLGADPSAEFVSVK